MKKLIAQFTDTLLAALTVSIAIFMAGCAISKPPVQTKILTDALPSNTVVPQTWEAGNDTNLVSNNWLRSFNDPGLDTIVAEAINNNLDLRKAATTVEIARENVIVVASKMKLQVGATLGYNVEADDGQSGVYGSSKAVGLVSWEPDIWGKLRAQKSSAEAGLQATSLDFAYARQSLVATTAKSWYITIETIQLEAIARQVVKLNNDILDVVKTRRRLGKVSDLDVVEARSNLNAAEGSLVRVQGLVSEARRNLETILGRYPAAEIKTAENFSPLPPPVAASMPAQLLLRRPDLLAAEQQVVIAFRNEEVAKLNFLPDFSLSLGAGRLSDAFVSLLKLNPWLIIAGIGVQVPVYTGGKLTAQLKIATAKQEAAVANYGIVVLRAFKEVENDLMNEDLLAQRVKYEEEVLVDRNESVRIATYQYKAGSIDLLSLLQLQNAQIISQVNITKLRTEQLTNRINLHLALGGSFD